MSDLSDERVREMIATAERAEVPGWVQLQPVTFIALARVVLALRERVAGLERERDVWRAKATHYDEAAGRDRARLLSEVATITRQRDEAVAVAREAMTGCGCGRCKKLRACLAAITGGPDADS